MTSSTSHHPPTSNDDDTPHDPFNQRIQDTGCFALHEALQDCHFDTKDWRACKAPMKAFRECMERYAAASAASSRARARAEE